MPLSDLASYLEATVGAFVERYNYLRYHESLANLTPADVYFSRDHTIIERRTKQTTDHFS